MYTQESYVILYGSAPGNLSQSSTPVNGSAYLNVIGGQFGANLTGLVPSSMYYFTIVASNTEGTTSTSPFPCKEGEGRGGQGRGE